MKPAPSPPETLHKMARYLEADQMAADITAQKRDGWALHSWYPTVEMFEQVDPPTGHRDRWPVTVFYALFYELPKPQNAPAPMAMR